MSIANHLVFDRWAQAVQTDRWPGTDADGNGRRLSMTGSSVIADGDTIYSYGRHFPMTTAIRNKDRSVRLILVNGDRWGNTTAQHQSQCRAMVGMMGYPSIIVPFTALDAAGIVHDSIEIAEVRPDRQQTFKHESTEKPGTEHPDMDDPSGATFIAQRWNYSVSPPVQEDYDKPLRVPDPNRVKVGRSNWLIAEWEPHDGVWRWETTRHWLGDSCFRARVREAIVTEEWGPAVQNGTEAWDLGYSTMRTSTRHPDGLTAPARGGFAYNEHTRWRERRAYFLSSFDYNEARPLYFLCELPRRVKPATVDEAYEALKPAEVLAAEAQGLDVSRQGDVFAIACPELTTREVRKDLKRGEAIVKRRHVLGTEHSTTEVALCKGGLTFGRGVMYHDVGWPRTRDHARRRMADGKTWHLLVRNTVPRA